MKEIKLNLNKIMITNDELQTLELKGITTPKISNQDCLNLMKSKEVKLIFEEKKKEILDKEEKEYLASVIKPFRDRVDYIEKLPFNTNGCYINIVIDFEDDCITLPTFDKNDMYLGMKINEEYSLEELGL